MHGIAKQVLYKGLSIFGLKDIDANKILRYVPIYKTYLPT